MTRWTLRTLAVAAGLLAGMAATRADDPAQKLGRYRTDDDKAPTASPLADDTEQVRHRGYGYGYGRSYYGGYRYPSYYGRSYYGGFSFGFSSYYAPRYYAVPSYYYVPSYYTYPSYYYGGYWGIGGTSASGATLTLNLKPAASTPPATVPTEPGFRYDGGPANPVPQPAPDRPAPQAAPPAEADAIKIAVKPAATAKPTTRYKAYGEK